MSVAQFFTFITTAYSQHPLNVSEARQRLLHTGAVAGHMQPAPHCPPGQRVDCHSRSPRPAPAQTILADAGISPGSTVDRNDIFRAIKDVTGYQPFLDCFK